MELAGCLINLLRKGIHHIAEQHDRFLQANMTNLRLLLRKMQLSARTDQYRFESSVRAVVSIKPPMHLG